MRISDKIIKEILQGVVDTFLIPKFNELNMNASGGWINSIEIRVRENVGEIWAADYTYQLVNGRAPGNMPPVKALEKYVMAKWGLSGLQATQAAWALATKIKNEGTSWHRKGGSDLLEVLESEEVAEYINKRMGEYLLKETEVRIKNMVERTLLKNG